MQKQSSDRYFFPRFSRLFEKDPVNFMSFKINLNFFSSPQVWRFSQPQGIISSISIRDMVLFHSSSSRERRFHYTRYEGFVDVVLTIVVQTQKKKKRYRDRVKEKELNRKTFIYGGFQLSDSIKRKI